MELTLDKYHIEEAKLIKEISENQLSCIEAQEQCKELFKLIPPEIIYNPRSLNDLMKQKFENDINWSYGKKYLIVV